ncbi:MAG: hypothetical protein CL758_02190 [Chloroflexi bacterium]|nr:hypothetical protein [Chloroflexota bacterium]
MAKRKNVSTKKTKGKNEKIAQESYLIDFDINGKDMASMVNDRRCYICCQGSEEESHFEIASDIKTIIEHCRNQEEYLLSDRPIKESLFRVILMNGNKPMTLDEIHGILSDKWSLAPYPRDISRKLLKNLIDNADEYGIISKNN